MSDATTMTADEFRAWLGSPAARRSKYGNVRTVVDGISFASAAEGKRYPNAENGIIDPSNNVALAVIGATPGPTWKGSATMPLKSTFVCRCCQRTLPRADFDPVIDRRGRPSGLNARCRACREVIGRKHVRTYVVHACEKCGAQISRSARSLCRACLQASYDAGWFDTTCSNCGKALRRRHCDSKNKNRFFCNKRCEGAGRGFGENLERIGGKLNADGYIYLKISGRNRLAHRVIMEDHLGRMLSRDEIVHHLNGVRHDNRIANLCIVTASTHEVGTYVRVLQARIRELENELQQIRQPQNGD